MQFVKVARVADFPEAGIRSFRILGKPVAVIRGENGSFRAMEAACKHQLADITTGSMVGMIATCPRHGWRYDLVTGECLHGGKGRLRSHGCKVEGEHIYVTLQPVE